MLVGNVIINKGSVAGYHDGGREFLPRVSANMGGAKISMGVGVNSV